MKNDDTLIIDDSPPDNAYSDDTPDVEDVVLEETDEENQVLGSRHTIASLRKELAQARKERDEYLAQLQRERADSINIRKREESMRASLKSVVVTDFCEKLLPVLDSFDAAMANKVAWESVDSGWRVGVEYIYQQLVGVLEDSGVKSSNPIGQQFDPALHEPHEYRSADKSIQPGTVIEVLQKGYVINGTVIRPARVVVARDNSDE